MLEPSEVLGYKPARLYRSVTMRLQYLAQDRPDIQFACKERARRMQAPTERDFSALKRLARYLKGKPRLVLNFALQDLPSTVTVHCDTDHAGCVETRKSMTGVALSYGAHTLRTNSNTQQDIGLSSGESEFYGAVKASSVALGAKAMFEDLGVATNAIVKMDATAGKAMVERRGLGRPRHIATRYLWIQQRCKAQDISVEKVATKDNPADLMTKSLDGPRVNYLCQLLRFRFVEGRSTLAPHLSGER